MNQKFLSLTPKRFLCPYCGEWHEWNHEHQLGYYNSGHYQAEFKCSNAFPLCCNEGDYRIYFYNDFCYYSTDEMCLKATLSISGKIPISSIIESTDMPSVTFEVPFTAESDVGSEECSECIFKDECICVKLGDKGDKRHMTITLGFEFEQSDYKELAFALKEKELQERENALDSKELALKELEQTIAIEEKALKRFSKEQAQQPQVKNKEDTTMANNNIFNLNIEFGPNKDENIASTLMGVAVKSGDSWRIYDKNKREIIDVGDMQLGNLPIFILPTTKLREGDLIKDSGEYYFVTKIATLGTPVKTLSAKTGEVRSIVPIKNVLGFNCYSKVIALGDSIKGDDVDLGKLVIMSAISGQTGENGDQMNNLLPLMLFKDELGEDDDITKLLLMSLITSEKDGGQMNQLLPLMLFKDKLGGDDDSKKLLLMSSMMGGNMASSNNLLMNLLMFDIFGKKKEDTTEDKTETAE